MSDIFTCRIFCTNHSRFSVCKFCHTYSTFFIVTHGLSFIPKRDVCCSIVTSTVSPGFAQPKLCALTLTLPYSGDSSVPDRDASEHFTTVARKVPI